MGIFFNLVFVLFILSRIFNLLSFFKFYFWNIGIEEAFISAALLTVRSCLWWSHLLLPLCIHSVYVSVSWVCVICNVTLLNTRPVVLNVYLPFEYSSGTSHSSAENQNLEYLLYLPMVNICFTCIPGVLILPAVPVTRTDYNIFCKLL